MTTLSITAALRAAGNIVGSVIKVGDGAYAYSTLTDRGWEQSAPRAYNIAVDNRTATLVTTALVLMGWDKMDADHAANNYGGSARARADKALALNSAAE